MAPLISRSLLGLPLALAISGCSDLNQVAAALTEPMREAPVPAVPNFALAARIGATGTQTLAGTAVQVNATTGRGALTTTSGTLTAPTGATVLGDGTATLNDPNGYDVESKLSDGAVVLSAYSGTRFQNMSPYESVYVAGGTTFNTEGVYGPVTDPVALAGVTSGSATYRGQSYGTLTTSGGTTRLIGTSRVTADFAADTVTAGAEDIRGLNSSTGGQFVTSVTSMEATGMTLSGNRFSGGTVTINGAGASTVTGSGTNTAAAGHFFGPLEAVQATQALPLEAGGAILAEGADGRAYMVFVSRQQ